MPASADRNVSRWLPVFVWIAIALGTPAAATDKPPFRRYPAEEARQAVAIDRDHFYAITNRAIGKYEKASGERVAAWRADDAAPLIHLNSGVVIAGELHCAHSNYPALPATSTVEVFDTKTLRQVRSHSFGIYEGSLTVITRHEDAWWAVFAHYANEEPRANRRTSLVRFDDAWRRTGAWVFPEEVLRRFGEQSCSGGDWGPDGRFWATGHDRGEIYQLELPHAGSTLRLIGIHPAPIEGQGIAWDRGSDNRLWGVRRSSREVVTFEVGADAD